MRLEQQRGSRNALKQPSLNFQILFNFYWGGYYFGGVACRSGAGHEVVAVPLAAKPIPVRNPVEADPIVRSLQIN